ncbi:PREDICTED: uncharacterized protein LOC108778367 isoform X2 [Cyphomyrmex costatus]|uniref:uncharacterized protein LOC108778367 isoform X2 n=1 Tax=Cyphomyrmex costatus TaxID=456900 RepID=UPI000852376E|nr:PREDICTED: uncharacterized protein LOC108778367 isoform X2 [Cyphomyrmex costatus]
MSFTSRTNRWASRVIIILQLVTWNAVGIILLHRGVSTLHRRILETNNVVEVNPPTGLESVVSSTRHEYDLSTEQQLIDQNIEIIIQIDPNRSTSLDDDRNLSELNTIRNERLKNASETILEKQRSTVFLADSLAVSTTDRGTLNSQLKTNHLTKINRRPDDHVEDKDVTVNKISRITRDKELILGNEISNNIHVKKDVTATSDYSESKTEGSVLREEEDLDLAENATRATVVHEMTHETSTLGKGADQDQFTIRTDKSNVNKLSRVNENIATTAVALVSIGAIMLLVGPIVIIMRILDERRQARKLMALPSRSREDLPPTYEQAVLMDEAPRYSTLALNYDRTPPPSPTLSSTYTFSNSTT